MDAIMEHPHPDQEPGPIGPAAIRWIQENPHAMHLIEAFALQAAARSRRIGMRLILERVRWEVDIATRGSKFKLNNNHAPYIARWLLERNPHLEGVILLRELRTP